MRQLLMLFTLLTVGIMTAIASGPSGKLPVLYININNGEEVTSKETYLKANYWLEPNGADGVDALGSKDEPLTLQIKGRGNYTFTGFEKKPYRLKLDKKQKLMGMKSSKHFGLLAHADDSRGFLRNTLGFEISKNLGLPWTPEQLPVELVVNGTYRGLYFAVELIRIDKNRVNITEWTEEDDNGQELEKWIEGGTLVEIDNYVEDGQITIKDGNGVDMRFTYDKSVDPGYEPDGYTEWLEQQFSKLNRLIYGDKNSDELWTMLDLEDCARFMLVQDIVNNYESFHGSCYMYREKGENEKWHFSPVWDFGSAFQPDHFPNTHFWENAFHYNYWAAQLWEFPKLREKMAELWKGYQKNGFNQLGNTAEKFLSNIKEAAECDKNRWPQYGNDNLERKLNYVKDFLAQSENFLNNEFDNNQEDPDEPKEFVVPEDVNGIYHLFFRQTGKAKDWPIVRCFYWGGDLSAPEWPGYKCEKVKVGDDILWHYCLKTFGDRNDYWVIFDNGKSGMGENQTFNLKMRKRGVYQLNMPDSSEPDEYLPVGAGSNGVVKIDTTEEFKISVKDGNIIIKADNSGLIGIYSIDGTVRKVQVSEGANTISLPKGIYFVCNRKVIL